MLIAIPMILNSIDMRIKCQESITDFQEQISAEGYKSAYESTHKNFKNKVDHGTFISTYEKHIKKHGICTSVKVIGFFPTLVEGQEGVTVEITRSKNYTETLKMLVREKVGKDGNREFIIEADGLAVKP